MSVTISKIEPIVVSQTLDEPFYFSQWEYQKRTICLVKITTNTGLVGWGEGYGPFGVVKAAIEFFQPLLVTFLIFHHFQNLLVKFGLSEMKHTKICAIFLILCTFT